MEKFIIILDFWMKYLKFSPSMIAKYSVEFG